MHRALTQVVLIMGPALWLSVPGTAQATGCAAITGSMSFGAYDTLLTQATNTTGTVQVICTPGVTDPLGTPYTVTLAGSGTGGDMVRSIAFGAYRLYYQVYKDPSHLTVWGNGTNSGSGVSSSVTSAAALLPAARTHTAYGRMPGQQMVPAGLYIGTLLVTVEY